MFWKDAQESLAVNAAPIHPLLIEKAPLCAGSSTKADLKKKSEKNWGLWLWTGLGQELERGCGCSHGLSIWTDLQSIYKQPFGYILWVARLIYYGMILLATFFGWGDSSTMEDCIPLAGSWAVYTEKESLGPACTDLSQLASPGHSVPSSLQLLLSQLPWWAYLRLEWQAQINPSPLSYFCQGIYTQ